MFLSAQRSPGASLTDGSWSVARIAGGLLPTAVLALVIERLDKIDQTLVARTLEAQRLHAVAHDEDLPAPHSAPDVELDVEDIPAQVLHTRYALPYVTLGRGSSQLGMMTIWQATRMLNVLSTAVAGL
jgi:hypothetical protein